AATQRIAEILARDPVDVVHVEGFYLMQHVPRWTPVPVLLAEQNVEYDLERQRAGTVELEDRFGVLLQCVRTRRAEIEIWQRAGRLVAITPEDQEMIQAAAPRIDVRVVPDGVDHLPACRATLAPPRVARPSDPLLALVANFAYPPNVDAALHLHQNIL